MSNLIIEKGKKYECIANIGHGRYDGKMSFSKGAIYSSEQDGTLINNFEQRCRISQIEAFKLYEPQEEDNIKPAMWCIFTSTEPLDGFEVGRAYKYQVDGPNSIAVYNTKAPKTFTWFSYSGFHGKFTVETKLANRKGVCRRTAIGSNYYITGNEYYFKYEAGKFFVQSDKPGEESSFNPDRFYELFSIGEEAYKPETVDMVNNPPHYKGANGLESIDVIENFGLGFNTGNAVKYILRAGKKNPDKHKEDLQKAIWYLNRELNKL